MGQWGIRVWRECSISRQRAKLYNGGIHVRGVRGESHNVTSGDTSAPRVRAVKSSKFGEGKL